MKHKNKRPTDPETLALQAELKAAQSDLALAYRQFDQATAPELVESCVYRTQTLKNNKMQPRAINFSKNIWKLLNKRLFLRCQS